MNQEDFLYQREFFKELLHNADARQNQTDDSYTAHSIVASSVIFSLAGIFLQDLMKSQGTQRCFLVLGLLFLILSIFFGLTHFADKRNFWESNGDKFMKCFNLWNSVVHGKKTEAVAIKEQEEILPQDHLKQKSIFSILQTWLLVIGTFLIFFSLIL